MRVKQRDGCWVLPLLAVASLGAAGQEVSLVDAVKRADTQAVRALLQRQTDVNVPEPDGTTALHWAAQRDDLETASVLIRAGADVNAANRYGVTPLLVACTNGGAAMIEALLKAGADPNAALPEGETALMTAARTGKADAVRLLLAAGADVNAREGWRGQTALMWAAAENHAAAARVLIESGADVEARTNGGFTPLLFAARAGRIEAVRVLLTAGADVDDTVQLGVPPSAPSPATPPAAGANVQGQQANRRRRGGAADGTSALVLATLNAHFALAAVLLDHGADANADAQGWTALHQLAWTRKPPIQHGLPPPVPTGSVESFELAEKLLAQGANPDARQTREPRDGARNLLNRIGSTPFLQAAKVADVEYMRLLLDHGADPALATEEGVSPLMAAAGVGIWHVGENAGTNEEALEAVKLAYEVGNDVNAADANGDTALHGAVHRGANEIVRFLVENGAKVDVPNEIGWTPWIIGDGVFYPNTYNRHLETAALLLELGADPKVGTRRLEDLAPLEEAAATTTQQPQ